MEQLTQTLLARADELMEHAPGQVHVRRISHIDDVRLLRSANEATSAEERQALERLRLTLMERLDGVTAPTPAASSSKEGGLLTRLLERAQSTFTAAQPQATLAQQDGPTRLPAPTALLDAAEAWVVSYLVADRIDVDLTRLRDSWDQASVEPFDHGA